MEVQRNVRARRIIADMQGSTEGKVLRGYDDIKEHETEEREKEQMGDPANNWAVTEPETVDPESILLDSSKKFSACNGMPLIPSSDIPQFM